MVLGEFLMSQKMKTTSIDRLIYKDKIFTTEIGKANSLNIYFVNIGASVEAKIEVYHIPKYIIPHI